MKENYQFMASRELKEFFKLIEKQYGKVPDILDKMAFIRGKENIYAITKDVDAVNMKNLRINSLGLYIAEVKNGQLRLSIEGAQLIGPTATKNVIELTEEQLKEWFKGNNLKIEGIYEGFAILKHKKDYVGSGKYKEGFILNFVPKARRLLEVH
jgi:NOL1/NOP2/fmu family ribosome biogenesis protein